jgi:hypothetical protein
MLRDGELFEMGWLPFADLSTLQASFDALPQDSYVKGRLRSRRYSRYAFMDGKLTRLSAQDFMQSSEINKALGDVERRYDDLDDALTHEPKFLKLFEEFKARTGVEDDCVIEVHQIRWHCKKQVKELAPEGVHQDGFDYVGMFMMNIHNVDGGEIMIYPSLDAAPLFKKRLGNGEFVVVNDREVYHNASPLVPTPNEEDGHWDIFVLTASHATKVPVG